MLAIFDVISFKPFLCYFCMLWSLRPRERLSRLNKCSQLEVKKFASFVVLVQVLLALELCCKCLAPRVALLLVTRYGFICFNSAAFHIKSNFWLYSLIYHIVSVTFSWELGVLQSRSFHTLLTFFPKPSIYTGFQVCVLLSSTETFVLFFSQLPVTSSYTTMPPRKPQKKERFVIVFDLALAFSESCSFD